MIFFLFQDRPLIHLLYFMVFPQVKWIIGEESWQGRFRYFVNLWKNPLKNQNNDAKAF